MVFRFFNKSLVLVFTISIGLLLFGCKGKTGNKVVVKGSTTVLPITQKASEEFKKIKNIDVSYDGSGSGNGIKALLDGTTDIANSSREMKDKEHKLAEKKKIKVKEIVVAYDMIVPVIHPQNKIKNLTLDQLKGIYDGSIKNWKEVGGKDENIIVVSRDTSSGTYEVWEKKVLKKADVRKDALLQSSNGAVVTSVSKNPKAIGYIGYGYVNKTVKPVYVNKIEPTITNGKSGLYSVSRKLYMYINEAKLSKNAQAFIDFLLSDAGQKIVKEVGYIPL